MATLTLDQLQKKHGESTGIKKTLTLEEIKARGKKKPAGLFKYDVPETPVDRQSKIARYQAEAAEAEAEAKRLRSPLGFGREFLRGITAGAVNLGETIGDIVSTPTVTKQLTETRQQQEDLKLRLIKEIRRRENIGEDATRLKQEYNRLTGETVDVSGEIGKRLPSLAKTSKQVLGEVLGTGIDVLTAGALRPAKAALGYARAPARLFTKRGLARVAEGAALGYGIDVSLGLQAGEEGAEVFRPGLGTLLGAGLTTLPGAYHSIRGLKTRRLNRAVDQLEGKYAEWTGGTKPGVKRLGKIEERTAALDRAGTTGKPPQRALAESGIIPETEGTQFRTKQQADKFRRDTLPLREANRTALKEVETQTPKINLAAEEEKAVRRARSPKNINENIADDLEKEIRSEYATYRKNLGNEISITQLDDIKSAKWGRVPFERTAAKPFQRDVNYIIAKTAQETIVDTASKAGLDDVAQLNRVIGDQLEAAKFLEALDGNTIKGGRLKRYVFQIIGATLGKSIPGRIAGALGGDVIAQLIIKTSVSSPVKRLILRQLQKKDPQAYTAVIKWLEKQGLDRELRLLLPEPSFIPVGAKTLTPSGAKLLPAKRTFGREPQTGRFKRVYTSEAAETPTRQNILAPLTKQADQSQLPVARRIRLATITAKMVDNKKAILSRKFTREGGESQGVLGTLARKIRETPSKQGGFVRLPGGKGEYGKTQVSSLIGLAGGTIVGALALSKIYGIPTDWTKNLTNEVKKTFPFDEEAVSVLGELGNTRQISLPGEAKGKYLQSGQEIFNIARAFGFSEKIAGRIADLGLVQKFDKANIQIEKDLKEPVQKILAHEMLHHIYNKKNDHFKNQKFAEDWYNSWNTLVEKDPEKYVLLGEIDDRLDRSGYNMDDPTVIANERYSYLGQEAMEKGIDAIPKELRQFYRGVIKMPIRNQLLGNTLILGNQSNEKQNIDERQKEIITQ